MLQQQMLLSSTPDGGRFGLAGPTSTQIQPGEYSILSVYYSY